MLLAGSRKLPTTTVMVIKAAYDRVLFLNLQITGTMTKEGEMNVSIRTDGGIGNVQKKTPQ